MMSAAGLAYGTCSQTIASLHSHSEDSLLNGSAQPPLQTRSVLVGRVKAGLVLLCFVLFFWFWFSLPSFFSVSTTFPMSFSSSLVFLFSHPQFLCPFRASSPFSHSPGPSLVSFSICQTNFGSSAFNENKTKGSLTTRSFQKKKSFKKLLSQKKINKEIKISWNDKSGVTHLVEGGGKN